MPGPFAPALPLTLLEVRRFLRLCVSPAIRGKRRVPMTVLANLTGIGCRKLHAMMMGTPVSADHCQLLTPLSRKIESGKIAFRRPGRYGRCGEPTAARRAVSVFLASQSPESKSAACVRFASRCLPHPEETLRWTVSECASPKQFRRNVRAATRARGESAAVTRGLPFSMICTARIFIPPIVHASCIDPAGILNGSPAFTC